MVVTGRSPRIRVALLALVGALSAAPGAAAAATVRGTVYADSRPVAGAAVALVDAATGEPRAEGTSGAAGAYALTASPGRVDLLVTAAGFPTAAVRGIPLGDDDVVQDVALLGHPSLTGVVRTGGGVPVAGATIYLLGTGDDGNGLLQVPPLHTDGEGRYAIDPSPAGRFRMQLLNPEETSPLLPSDWMVEAPEFAVGGATVLDVTLPPVATLSGRVTAAGAPVPGTVVAVGQHAWSVAALRLWVRSRGEAGAGGDYAVRGFAAGPSDVTVTPPAASGFSAVNTRVDLAGDLLRDFALARPSLEGVVRTADGIPVAGAEVLVTGAGMLDYQEVLAGPVPTDDEGRYRFDQVPAGRAYLEIRGTGGGPGSPMPPTWRSVLQDFEVLESGVRDVTLPRTAAVGGRIADDGGAPVPGTEVLVNQVVFAPPWWVVAKGPAPPVGPSGEYAIRAFAVGRAELVVTPPAATGLSTFYHLFGDLYGDRRQDFTLSRIVLSGVLRTAAGVPVTGAQVAVMGALADLSFQHLTEPVTTDGEGRYRIEPAPGGIAYLDAWNPDDRTGLLPRDWRAVSLDYGVRATATRDVTLPPVAALRGWTTDANGVPVGGVEVVLDKVAWSLPWFIATQDGQTSPPSGEYAARAFALGATTLTIRPPLGSGFTTSAPVGFALLGDRLMNVVLDLRDAVAPVILSGPVVSKVTDTTAVVAWTTDEPARGGLRYGLAGAAGTVVEEEGFATAHAVTLTGLVPGAWYAVSVFATDLAGNGPAESGGVAFRTLDAADTTPPAFTAGPVVDGVTHERAVVAWATDEACAGVVRYGSGGETGSTADGGDPATAQAVALEGLAPATAHVAIVECTDAAGNTAVSALIPFVTAPAPDAAPPVIVEGPLVTDVTDTTATLEWTTDEPATGGVSWNDGTAHGLVSDPALVTAHRVTITGLAPATAYVATVSSTDAAGNGPTLAGPLPFTTRAAVDVRPPVIVDGPVVVNVTHQSAVIRWATDEPADGVVEHGPAPDALDRRDAHAALTRSHNQALTGLEAGATHFYRVCSTDAAGNTACSAVGSFATDPPPSTAVGAGADAPAAVAGLAVTYVSDRAAVVAWTTPVPTDSRALFQGEGGIVRQAADGAKVLEHRLTLAGLEPGVRYALAVGGADERGVPATPPPAGAPVPGTALPAHLAFATLATPDATPPAIVEGPEVVEVGDRRAVVRWATDEAADAVVRFGPRGVAPDGLAAAIARTTRHRLVLTNLQPGTHHRVVVRSADPAGNAAEAAPLDFTTAPPAPLFADAFDGADGADPDWLVGGGSWSVGSGAYRSSPVGEGHTTIARFAGAPLAAGVVRARVKLTAAFARKANGSIVFAVQDPGRYRYVRLEEGRVVVGQRGDFGGVPGGVKRSFAADVAVGRGRTVTVELDATGRVRVSLGPVLVGAYRFPGGAVAGGVGLAASRARAVFDDVKVWGPAAGE